MKVSAVTASPRRVYAALAVFSLALLGAMGYVLHTGMSVSTKHVPLVRASEEIKLDATLAHLWFEEILSGDRHERMDEVRNRLVSARRNARAMIEGERDSVPAVVPLDDPRLVEKIRQVQDKLAEFEAITAERWSARQTAVSGSEIDQAYDAIFREFIALTEEVGLELRDAIGRDTRTVRRVQISVIGGAVALLILVGILFARYTHQRQQVEESLKLKAEAEAQAQKHREELAHVVRRTTMSELAAGIAHEINQPLTAISTSAAACRRLIESGRALSTEHLSALDLIGAEASRASNVIVRLRTFLGRRESNYEAVNLNDLVRGVVTLGELVPEMRRAAIRLDLADDLPEAEADAVQIQQVLLNLVRNGYEAMQGSEAVNAAVMIRTRVDEHGDIEVAVVDRGVGIPEEVAGATFDPFFTTKESGMGMGLSISHSIIAAHGGRIWFRPNEHGRGTTFLFTLPSRAKAAS